MRRNFGSEKIGRQVGQKIGMAVAAVIPVLAPVGMAVGSFVGATVGRIGDSMIGKAVTKAAKKLAEATKPVLKRAWEGIKSVGGSIMNGIHFFLRKGHGRIILICRGWMSAQPHKSAFVEAI